MQREAITGVILAGGRAARMGGVPKGMLEKDGKPIALALAEALSVVTCAQLLVADTPGPYAALGLRAVPDAVSGAGPAGGLLAALEHARTPFVLVVACDMPALGPAVLALLRDRPERFDVVVPVLGGLVEPLCARWATRTAGALRAAIESGERKMASLLTPLVVERLQEPELRMADPTLELATNVNTPADAARLGLRPGRWMR